MFRVRLASGEEAVFETVDELALGIQGGAIPASAEIFHSKTQQWLPISVHPVFEQAATLTVGSVAALEPESGPLELVNPTDSTQGGTVPIYHMISKSALELAERRRPKWIAPVVGISGGAVMLAALGWMLFSSGLSTPQSLPLSATRQYSLPTGAGRFATEGIRSWDMGPAPLANRMATALDSAGQRLANDAGELGISGLVSADRMETPEAVQATHRALLMFRPMLDRYRATQRALTRVYEDSVATLVRSGAWTRTDLDEWRVRDIPVEPARYVARGDSLVAALARLYELLQEQQGAVQVTAEWARFNESAAGDEYDSLRARIQRLMLTNRPGDQGSVSPTLLLLMAIAGDGSPPPRLSD